MEKTICLAFDVEDYFQVENLENHFPPERWDSQDIRAAKGTYEILDILASFHTKVTVFIWGWLAEKVQQLVKNYERQGYYVQRIHRYLHLLFQQCSLSKKSFEKEE